MASNEFAEKEFEKWKLYHRIYGKSISELSPEINVILRKYAIKKLYELSQVHPFIKQKVDNYFKIILTKGQAEKIAKNFDVDKYCIYEDYTNLIEKIYESAEDEFEVKILQNDFSNYLQLIAVYRLLVDMIELVNIWKEKDENISKFQTYCKYRIVQIMDKKKNKTNNKGFDSDIEQEFKVLKEEINQDEANDLFRAKTCIVEDIQNKSNNEHKNNIESKEGLKSIKTMTKAVKIHKKEENLYGNLSQSITGVQNPYSAILFDINKPQSQEGINESITREQPTVFPSQKQEEVIQNNKEIQQTESQTQLTSQQENLLQQQYYQQQYNLQQQYYQQYQERISQNQYQPQSYDKFQQKSNINSLSISTNQINQYQKTNTQVLPQPQNKSQKTNKPVLNRKKVLNKNEQYIEEIEKMKKELERLNDLPDEQKKKKNEQMHQTEQVHKPEIKKKKEIDILSNVFKQQTTPMLNEYVYNENRLKVTLPFKYQSNNYFGVIDYFKKTLIPATIKEVQNNNYNKALENSEDMLYCLTNILPK